MFSLLSFYIDAAPANGEAKSRSLGVGLEEVIQQKKVNQQRNQKEGMKQQNQSHLEKDGEKLRVENSIVFTNKYIYNCREETEKQKHNCFTSKRDLKFKEERVKMKSHWFEISRGSRGSGLTLEVITRHDSYYQNNVFL